jgi:dihydrofolate synthase/folylpolyglutamate synthase
MARFKDSDEVFDYLMRLVNVERGQATVFKLDRMAYLANELGNPQNGRITIHIAGSKGKGSVAAMSAGILKASGHLTGLYTSPHFQHWKERITLADSPMPEKLLLSATDEVLAFVDGRSACDFPGDELPTFFEVSTLIAFCAFRMAGAIAQVIEVGLGGRLDSTNIVDPDVSVITPIELEHTQFLGDTIAKIAYEKAGIIKSGKPVCIAPQREEALDVFKAVAASRKAPLHRVDEEITISSCSIDASGTNCVLSNGRAPSNLFSEAFPGNGLPLHSPMVGVIQASNMALAFLACSLAIGTIDPEIVQLGLESAKLPARFEIASTSPPIVLDGAHTPESAKLAVSTFARLFPGKRALLFGCAHDKHHGEMAEILSPFFETIIITKPGTFKQSDPEAVFESFSRLKPDTELITDTEEAIKAAFSRASEGQALLVTGSFYLCSEAGKRLS